MAFCKIIAYTNLKKRCQMRTAFQVEVVKINWISKDAWKYAQTYVWKYCRNYSNSMYILTDLKKLNISKNENYARTHTNIYIYIYIYIIFFHIRCSSAIFVEKTCPLQSNTIKELICHYHFNVHPPESSHSFCWSMRVFGHKEAPTKCLEAYKRQWHQKLQMVFTFVR